jgi:predicted transposase YbfD/YdcC
VAVETIRSVNGSGKVQSDIRYFLSRCHDRPEALAQAVRRHWQIENNLHWVLDVIFGENHCRIRDLQLRSAAQDRPQSRLPPPDLAGQSQGTPQDGRLGQPL